MDIKPHAPRGTMVLLGWSNRLGEDGGDGGGGGSGGGGGGDEDIPPESFQLYGSGRNQVIAATYTRGFELWQQQQQIQRPQQQYSLYPPSTGLLNFGEAAVSAGGPLGRCGDGGAIEFGMRGRFSGGGGVSCQDCGNQSKKDCAHMRCRTCCKSHGFHCPTHLKSTWIPASKRRERQHLAAATAALQQQSQQSAGIGGEPSKRPRETTTRLPTTITTTSPGNGGTEAPGFPAEVSSPVVFRCVRVSPLDEADDEMAYQTEVSIQGHVFKGILYDYGPDAQHGAGESTSSSAAAFLTASTASVATAMATSLGAAAEPAVDAAATTSGLMDTSSIFPQPFVAFMAGTQFFPQHPRP